MCHEADLRCAARWALRSARRALLAGAALLAPLAAGAGPATAPEPWPATEAAGIRQELGVQTTTRDGVVLVSDLWLPAKAGRYPLVLHRTPYMRSTDSSVPFDGMIRQARRYAAAGIAFMIQDMRGRGESGGEFTFLQNEARDGYDSIEWIARQPWSNGQVAMLGGSYKGTAQWLAARERPPHLTCLFSQSPAGDFFNEVPYSGGAFQTRWAMSWPLMVSGRLMHENLVRSIDYDALLTHRPLATMDVAMGRELPMAREFLRHPTFDDWWRRVTLSPADFARLDVPAFHVSGWYDGDLPGNMHYWNGMREHSPGRARQHLLIGPWTHAESRSGGSATIGDRTRGPASVVDVEALAMRWFRSCFDGTTDRFDAPRARVFLTGLNRWLDLPDYPAPSAQTRRLFLRSGGDAPGSRGGRGALSWSAPPAREPPDAYLFDPLRPAPARGAIDRFALDAGGRADLLVYQTAAVAEPLAMLGPVDLVLHVATSARDTDFVADLYDVDPAGRALRLVFRTAILRARYREGFDRQVPMTPGAPTALTLRFFDIGHVLLPGHRLRLEVASSTPGITPNHNTGNDVGTDTVFTRASQRVFHDGKRPSHLAIPVIAMPPAAP
jgi:uncharacterized protein